MQLLFLVMLEQLAKNKIEADNFAKNVFNLLFIILLFFSINWQKFLCHN